MILKTTASFCIGCYRLFATRLISQSKIAAPSKHVRKLKKNPPLATSNPNRVSNHPPIKPPIMPVMMLAIMPMEASRLLSLDAIHPASPPMIIHPRKPSVGVMLIFFLL
mgnify:CR=1 FL=1